MSDVEPGDAMSGADFPASFRVVAGRLGWGATRAAGARLERLVLDFERASGKLICIRKRGRRRTRRKITVEILERELGLKKSATKQLAAEHEAAASEFRTYIAAIDENIRIRAREESEAAIAEIVQPQLTEIRAETLGVRRDLNALAQRVQTSTAKHN